MEINNEILVVAINFRVVEFNEHYCILHYDDDRTLKLYSFDKEYKMIKEYYEQSEEIVYLGTIPPNAIKLI